MELEFAESYGDATSIRGKHTPQYILAQIPSDVDLEWVREVRSKLVIDEVKWQDVKSNRPSFEKPSKVWNSIERTFARTSIFISDPNEHIEALRELWEEQQAVLGIDFDKIDLLRNVGYFMVTSSPIVKMGQSIHSHYNQYAYAIDHFGQNLKDAKIFAARSEAIVDQWESAGLGFASNLRESTSQSTRLLTTIINSTRTFDEENNRLTVDMNSLLGNIAATSPLTKYAPRRNVVVERPSNAFDELQAADVAAGFVRDHLLIGDQTTIFRHFKSVKLNGRLLSHVR